MKTNILILAAGKPASIEGHDTDFPLCLTELEGVSLIERIINNTSGIKDSVYAFAILDSDAERFHLDNVIKVLLNDVKIIRVPESTKGSACTALLAACRLAQDMPLLIISANELVDIDLSLVTRDFHSRNLDAGTLIFESIHPRYSFVKLNDNGLATQATQRNPISKHATAGVFWFKRTRDFVEATKNSIRKSAEIENNYYVAPTFNELILKQQFVGVYEIDAKKYRPLKTERQITNFEYGITK